MAALPEYKCATPGRWYTCVKQAICRCLCAKNKHKRTGQYLIYLCLCESGVPLFPLVVFKTDESVLDPQNRASIQRDISLLALSVPTCPAASDSKGKAEYLKGLSQYFTETQDEEESQITVIEDDR